ncbi:MAG: cytidine deaminase [Eubacteriales bacterium]|nr:cytidine deaminase [Eubacteriales bacterium]
MSLNSEQKDQLIRASFYAQKMAYVPYSKFRVGAAALAADGQIYTGCNIENASFGATICAERTAVVKAVSTGNRRIKAMAVITDAEEFARPCGICRQVLAEFAADDFILLALKPDGTYVEKTLADLLPDAFSPDSLS